MIYKDPPESNPTSAYGLIVELDQLTAKKPKKHYFHMLEIMTLDGAGDIDLNTNVSLIIIIPAKKGFQADIVIIADHPNEEEAVVKIEAPLKTAMEEMHVGGANGTFGEANETFGEANEMSVDATGQNWGSGGR